MLIDDIRTVMASADRPMTRRDIADLLGRWTLASTAAPLRRMERAGEIRRVDLPSRQMGNQAAAVWYAVSTR